jgi:hypothetical protein
MLAVCGHIHEARGVERLRWNTSSPENGCLVADSEVWTDPGVGSNKQSLVNLTSKGGRPLENCSRLTRQRRMPSISERGGQAETPRVLEPSALDSASRTGGVVLQSEAKIRAMLGGAYEHRQGSALSDVGLEADEPDGGATARIESVIVNAALLGPRLSGTASKVLNKPVVIDIDLPVWYLKADAE